MNRKLKRRTTRLINYDPVKHFFTESNKHKIWRALYELRECTALEVTFNEIEGFVLEDDKVKQFVSEEEIDAKALRKLKRRGFYSW